MSQVRLLIFLTCPSIVLVGARTAGYLFNFPTTPVPSTLLQALCNLMCGVVDLPVPGLRATSHSGNDSTATWMCHPTHQVTNVRPSRDSPHRAVIPRDTPEYQCPWFQFYRASNFYCMAIATEPLLPSGPPLAANLTAVNITVALETTRHAPGAVRQAGGDKLRHCCAAAAAAAIAMTKIGRTRIAKMPTAMMLTRTTGMGGPHDRPCARP